MMLTNFYLAILLLPIYGFSNLNHYLKQQGIAITEGYISDVQKEAMCRDLKEYKHINKILEIGFNAGHSAEMFLENCPLASIVSVDINEHFYTSKSIAFIQNQYLGRFTFIEGDSHLKIPEYAKMHPEEKFDLIFIDGCHTYESCLADIQNCYKLAHKDTILWIDDYHFETVANALLVCMFGDIINEFHEKSVIDSLGNKRVWAVSSYLFK